MAQNLSDYYFDVKDYKGNPYQHLGIERSASDSDIKKAYRTLSLKFHPDKNPDNEEAQEKFQEICKAYNLLSDPEKRRIYNLFNPDPKFTGTLKSFLGWIGKLVGRLASWNIFPQRQYQLSNNSCQLVSDFFTQQIFSNALTKSSPSFSAQISNEQSDNEQPEILNNDSEILNNSFVSSSYSSFDQNPNHHVKIELTVRYNGSVENFEMKLSEKIEALKEKIAMRIDVSVEDQILRFNGEELTNGKSLFDCKLRDKSSVILKSRY